jgi:hypothetical protein
MYRSVTFRCADPGEWGYDEQGDPVTPGGKAVADEIALSLVQGGARVSDVEQHEDYGWGFTSHLGRDSFYQVVNAPDNEVYLTIQMEGYLLGTLLLRRPRRAFDRYCELVGATLTSIPGVSEIRWGEYEA